MITRGREDQRGVMRRQIEERGERREDREDRREEREHMRHLQMIAALTRSPQPQHPQVTITQARYATTVECRLFNSMLQTERRHCHEDLSGKRGRAVEVGIKDQGNLISHHS